MKEIKGIIFDLDGTIVDTEGLWAQATKEMLIERGIIYNEEIKLKIQDTVQGLTPLQANIKLKSLLNLPDDPHILAEEKKVRAHRLIREKVCFIKGFETFYNKVSERFKLAIATNCPWQIVDTISARLDLTTKFNNHIYNPMHVKQKAKPHPAVYIHAAQRLNLEVDQCIAIEDSRVGIESAVHAGMYCIGLNTGKESQNLNKAHMIIKGYEKLTAQVFKQNY